MEPDSISRLAITSVYASIIHCSPERLACRSCWIAGNATLTIVTSMAISSTLMQHIPSTRFCRIGPRLLATSGECIDDLLARANSPDHREDLLHRKRMRLSLKRGARILRDHHLKADGHCMPRRRLHAKIGRHTAQHNRRHPGLLQGILHLCLAKRAPVALGDQQITLLNPRRWHQL